MTTIQPIEDVKQALQDRVDLAKGQVDFYAGRSDDRTLAYWEGAFDSYKLALAYIARIDPTAIENAVLAPLQPKLEELQQKVNDLEALSLTLTEAQSAGEFYGLSASIAQAGDSLWFLLVSDTEGDGVIVGQYTNIDSASEVRDRLNDFLIQLQAPALQPIFEKLDS